MTNAWPASVIVGTSPFNAAKKLHLVKPLAALRAFGVRVRTEEG